MGNCISRNSSLVNSDNIQYENYNNGQNTESYQENSNFSVDRVVSHFSEQIRNKHDANFAPNWPDLYQIFINNSMILNCPDLQGYLKYMSSKTISFFALYLILELVTDPNIDKHDDKIVEIIKNLLPNLEFEQWLDAVKIVKENGINIARLEVEDDIGFVPGQVITYVYSQDTILSE